MFDRDIIQWHDDRPDYAKTSGTSSGAGDKARAPLDVPPELRAELELPMAGEVASHTDEKLLSKEYQEAVAGKSVSLEAKVYDIEASKVFSAVVDAMTSLNAPVQSVDSPSGIVTTDWIRKGANTPTIGDMFGVGGAAITRHRFIVRVFRAKVEEKEMTKLEIRALAQSFESRRWMNKRMKRNVIDEVFVAVEEQLTRMQRGVTAN